MMITNDQADGHCINTVTNVGDKEIVKLKEKKRDKVKYAELLS